MKIYISIISLGLLFLGAACQKTTTPKTSNVNQSSSGQVVTNSVKTNVNNVVPTNTSAGRYVDYSNSVIASTPGQKILFFHAPWCPQCRQLEQSITSGAIPTNVTIIKVDYDTNQSLRQQYGVTLQTTVVLVDDRGKLIKKFNAYDDPSLNRIVRELL